jgi:putative two-component system response regulator
LKSHTEIVTRILGKGNFPLLDMACEISRHHHERWDGRGYLGLREREIPLSGRIVAVADVFDTITHRRPYKEARDPVEAVARIRDDAGKHFDPEVVAAFLRVVQSGRLSEVERHDSRAREGFPRELTARGLQPRQEEIPA